jgi:hypothetical protein
MLKRNVLIDGKIYDTHEIVLIASNLATNETVITVASSNAEERIERSTALVLMDGLTIAEAEEVAWSLERYSEYVDESAELLNDVLDILTDEQAEQVPQAFKEWEVGAAYKVGDRRRYDDKLYRCVQAHTSQEGWEPPNVPALWTRTAPESEIPDWVQPTGAQDAYNMGDKVKHNGKTWESDVDANVWEPSVYGWTEVV